MPHADPLVRAAHQAAYQRANRVKQNAYRNAWAAARRIVDPDWQKENRKRYVAENPERVAAKAAAWKKANLDRFNAYQAGYRVANAEKIATWQRLHYQANAERLRAQCRSNYASNREKMTARQRQRYASDRKNGIVRTCASIRRERLLKAEGTHTRSDIQALGMIQRHRCAMCKISIRSKYHVDHIMPLALGGRNSRNNLQLLCAPCNLSKGPKHPIVFAQSRGLLL